MVKYIPIKLVVKASEEVAKASADDKDKDDISKADLDKLFREAKESVSHEQPDN